MMKLSARSIFRAALAALLLSAFTAIGQTPVPQQTNWREKLNQVLPLLGHRNWILIVDSAYPLQNSPGIQTVDTGAGQLAVLRDVLSAIDRSIHVRPIVFMDAELRFVPEHDAPGVTQYRNQVRAVLGGLHVTDYPHEQLLQKVNDVSKSYSVLILKTNETIPYTSVFLQLNCKYWSDQDETRLREAMKRSSGGPH